MKSEIVVLPVHSFAGITTNSSSELFVCSTQETDAQIRDFLHKLSELTGKHHGVGEIKVYHGIDGLKEIVEELWGYLVTLGEILDKMIPFRILRQILPYPSCEFPYNELPSNKLDRKKSTLKEATQARKDDRVFIEGRKKLVFDYIDKHAEVLEPYLDTITTIRSIEDNSIPYEFFDLLEERYNGQRFHIG